MKNVMIRAGIPYYYHQFVIKIVQLLKALNF